MGSPSGKLSASGRVREGVGLLAEVGDESAISTLEWAGENYVASYPEEYSFGEAAAEAIARIRERLRAVDRAQG